MAPSVPSAAWPVAPPETITSTPLALPLTSMPAARPVTSSRVPPGSPNKIHGVAGWPLTASQASSCAGPLLTVRSAPPGRISAANTSLAWKEPEIDSVNGESPGGMSATAAPLASGVIANPVGALPGWPLGGIEQQQTELGVVAPVGVGRADQGDGELAQGGQGQDPPGRSSARRGWD